MIIKRTRGVDARKALAYDYGPGRAMEHHDPRRVAGTVAGRDWKTRARTMQTKLRTEGDATEGKRGRVIRLAVAAAPGDRVMSDREWSTIARRVVGEFTGNAEGYSWEAVRHDPRHIHITLLQRGHDGRLLSESHDYRRFGRISDGIEHDYQLTRVERGAGRSRSKARTAEPPPAAPDAATRDATAGLRPPGWAEMTADQRREWYREHIAPHPERVRRFQAEARPRGGAERQEQEPAPRAAPEAPQADRPHLGWASADQARKLGPRPADWETWTERRQQAFIRERLGEFQARRREQERGNDEGRER